MNTRQQNNFGPVDANVPHDYQAEEAVLGSFLIDRDAIVKVASWLKPEHFHREHHAWVYGTVLSLYERREPPDPVTLAAELTKQGRKAPDAGWLSWFVNLGNRTPTAVHLEYYANIVVEAAMLRQLISIGGEIAASGYDREAGADQALARAQTLLDNLRSERINRGKGFQPIEVAVSDQLDEMERIAEEGLRCVSTGFEELDWMLGGGWQAPDLVLIASRPGGGKSAFTFQEVVHCAKKLKKRVAVVPLEMSGRQLVQRTLAGYSGVDTTRIRSGRYSIDEYSLITDVAGWLGELDIEIDDTPGLSIDELTTRVINLHAAKPLDMLVVDYGQLLTDTVRNNDNAVAEQTAISRKLKVLARQINAPVLCAAQLNRDAGTSVPRLDNLAGSDSWGRDADIVIVIHRPEMYAPTSENAMVAEFHFIKQRNGPLDKRTLRFDAAKTQFSSWDWRQEA